jgi:FAD/FMN-containing dehydrogenase
MWAGSNACLTRRDSPASAGGCGSNTDTARRSAAEALTSVACPVPLAALSRRVKDAFDPAHILNPGRMVEGS